MCLYYWYLMLEANAYPCYCCCCIALQIPLPPTAIVGTGKPSGKVQYPDPYANTNPAKVDMYSLMTFKPMSSDETGRIQSAWNDSARQPRKKAAMSASGLGAQSLQELLASAPPAPARFVPFGGLAQERGMTLDAIVANRKHFKR
jgi:hypothetical protein